MNIVFIFVFSGKGFIYFYLFFPFSRVTWVTRLSPQNMRGNAENQESKSYDKQTSGVAKPKIC